MLFIKKMHQQIEGNSYVMKYIVHGSKIVMLVDKFFLCDVCSDVIRLHHLKRHILERQITLFIVTCNIIRYRFVTNDIITVMVHTESQP